MTIVFPNTKARRSRRKRCSLTLLLTAGRARSLGMPGRWNRSERDFRNPQQLLAHSRTSRLGQALRVPGCTRAPSQGSARPWTHRKWVWTLPILLQAATAHSQRFSRDGVPVPCPPLPPCFACTHAPATTVLKVRTHNPRSTLLTNVYIYERALTKWQTHYWLDCSSLATCLICSHFSLGWNGSYRTRNPSWG